MRQFDPEARYAEVYNTIIKYKQEHDGNSPTLRELIERTSYTSTSMVARALRELVKCGMTRMIKKGRTRSIEVVGAKWLAPDDAYFFAHADIVDVLSVLETEKTQ